MLSGKLRYFLNKTNFNLNLLGNKNSILNINKTFSIANSFSKVNNFGIKYMRKLRKRKKK
jgi:hypothetical protein